MKMSPKRVLSKQSRSFSALLYFLAIAFVASWWLFFFSENATPPLPISPVKSKPVLEKTLSRKEILQALRGDFALMGALILRWDREAQHRQLNRLPADKVLRAHYLAEMIPTLPKRTALKILPQTYLAAGILLTIATPADLVALPRGFREQTYLFDSSVTEQIPLDVDHYTTEKLFLSHPQIAFVSSHYTHPAALQALANQGIPIHASPICESIKDVMREIETTGRLIGREEEAELLQLFIEAALFKLDQIPKETQNTLFLSYYDHFYLPLESNITGALILRAGLPLPKIQTFELKEKLLQWDPQTLVIATPRSMDLLPFLQHDPGYSQLQAVRKGRIRFVDDEVMQTPTHSLILAYYDLIEALQP